MITAAGVVESLDQFSHETFGIRFGHFRSGPAVFVIRPVGVFQSRTAGRRCVDTTAETATAIVVRDDRQRRHVTFGDPHFFRQLFGYDPSVLHARVQNRIGNYL